MKKLLALSITLLFAACASRQPAPAPATGMERAKPAAERPGIGTAWGETRESWVEPTYFARVWGSRPSAKAQLFYNDHAGTDAALDYIGGEPSPSKGLQPVAGGLVHLGLRNGDGRWLEAWELKGQRFIAGDSGERYEIVLQNITRRRVEVVVSVDGLDSLDGKTASTRKRGTVLSAGETLAVEGFRTSDGTVSAFRFGSMGQSYAKRRHGDDTNNGVIGLAVFEERWLLGPAAVVRPENRAWRKGERREYPASRDYAKPPEA